MNSFNNLFKISLVFLIILFLLGKCSPAFSKKSHNILTVKITDFWRSPSEQAFLLQRLKNTGVDLSKLYVKSDMIKEIEESENIEEVEIIIRKYINLGIYLSKHMCGRALDIGKDKGIKDFISFMSSFDDIKILDEGNHFHLEITTKCNN